MSAEVRSEISTGLQEPEPQGQSGLERAIVFEAEASASTGPQKLYLTERGDWVLEELRGERRTLAPGVAHGWLFEHVHGAERDTGAGAALRERVAAVPMWWHSIDLGHGVVTPGHKTPAILSRELQGLQIPDLVGKSVLDIGAWDGFFSFEAERRGASRVVALDHFVWCQELGPVKPFGLSIPDPADISAVPETVDANLKVEHTPGKLGFNTAHTALGSRVESVVADFMQTDLDALGQFDVVFFFGVLYHMEHPIESMRRLAALTREVAIIETEAVAVQGQEGRRLCEFYPGTELNNDPTNWWAPNTRAVEGLALEAGFRQVVALNPPDPATLAPGELRHYRAYFHAFK